ncbi:MAG TPA: hypothetical protein EYG67_02500 [Campylobacterales bacterium]|nr:hypothetical protein [Campylobacterales bacterium]HIP41255.1 hypothetical protein [Campylobacterales bacterium]
MKMQGEPSLEQIDDYNNNESPEKRRTVRLLIVGILVVGAIYAMVKYSYSTPSDYIGTPENPGINTSKH